MTLKTLSLSLQENTEDFSTLSYLTLTYNHWIKPLTFFENRYELIFDLVIVTHIDCDHIGGIVAFLEDCEKNCRVGLKEIWHNGLFQIGGKKF